MTKWQMREVYTRWERKSAIDRRVRLINRERKQARRAWKGCAA